MKYKCVKQHDLSDCGVACIASIAKYYGLDVSLSKLRILSGTDVYGTNISGILRSAKDIGFSCKAVKGKSYESLFTEFPLPAIALVTINSLPHYIVVYKISSKYIVYFDPSQGIVKSKPDEFFEIWEKILILLVPTAEFEIKDKNNSTLIKFFKLLIPQKKLILTIFLISLLVTAFGIIASFYFRFIMDDIVPNSLLKTLNIISIGIILLYIFKILLEFFRNHLMLYLSQKLDIPLVLGYYHHVLNLPMDFFSTRKVGEIISRFMDASKIRNAISGATLTIMIDTIMAIVGGIVLYKQNSLLFGISVILLLLYGIIVFCYNKPIKKINKKQMEDNSQVTSYLVESLNGIETVKSFNAEDKAQYKTEKLFIKFLKSIFKGGFLYNGQQSLTNAVYVIGETVILWVGTISILNGNLTIGELITFNALLAYFLDPVKNLINLQPTMQTAIVAADRLGEILDLDPEKKENEENKIKNVSLNKEIEISNLDFRYGTRQLVLKNINVNIKSGEKIALVGESGSGKTTLVKLLMNFYEFEKGEIMFGDYNIKDINIESLRDKIAYISQDIFLFSGSIRENLMLGNEDATLDEIIEACKLSKANEFIEKMPLRYETLLEENGANLSGGQKQRLAIARALLKKPDILIMDEATSNLDSITEKAIEKTINELSNNITTIIIAHRLSTIMRCDRIYVMENGEIIEQGSHTELMNDKKNYYNLWKEQLPVQNGDDNFEAYNS